LYSKRTEDFLKKVDDENEELVFRIFREAIERELAEFKDFENLLLEL